MSRTLCWLLISLSLLSCRATFAQSLTSETADRQVELGNSAKARTTELPDIHLIDVKHADPIELSEGLSKIFDANVKAGQLAIFCDSRAKRLVIRSSDEDFSALRGLVEKLDTPSQADEHAATVSSLPTKSESPNFDTYWRVLRQIKDPSIETSGAKTLLEKVHEAVRRDFESQQQELHAELARLRTKMDSLEALLEKRKAQKNAIIGRRIQAFLQTVGTLPDKNYSGSDVLLSEQTTGQQSATYQPMNNPLFTDPLASPNSKELGQAVLEKRAARESAAERTEWRHSYGENDQVQEYFVTLADYCRLRESLVAHHPQTKQLLRKLVANTATDQEIRAAAWERQQELDKHIKSQEALVTGTGRGVPFLSRAMSMLAESGRQGLEKWLASESNTKSSDDSTSFASPKSRDAEANAPKQ